MHMLYVTHASGKIKGSQNSLLKTKNTAGGIMFPNFKQYYKTIVVKNVQCKNRYICQ